LIVGILGCITMLEMVGVLPSKLVLLDALRESYLRYGAPFIFLVSAVENIVGVNAYFPGSIVILAGMAMTSGKPEVALLTWLMIWAGCIGGNVLDYHLGRWRKNPSDHSENPRRSLSGTVTLYLLSMWHPHYGALSSAIVGAEGVGFSTFLFGMLIGSFVWYVFWGGVMYIIGARFKMAEGMFGVYIGAVLVWAAIDLLKAHWARGRSV
jgi:membrane protein YqaA with SNARE-associated domain